MKIHTEEEIQQIFAEVERCKVEKGIDVVPLAIDDLWEKDKGVRNTVTRQLWDKLEAFELRRAVEAYLKLYSLLTEKRVI